ncbi:hypothetical protein HanXRQr2_Chr13g0573371 [Helianthus annuus]|uniref:Uncharacterized protein n=1 Tax=Helianthus annuus TaxID=4232 RepID=A0A251SPA9_HELAN|nr:UPF0481 protein At3g47200 [Helianthus annuus]KAF5772144.1 hypothetical protein HanXRQr2_Chr13g0573371 [Helianthus annuus]KAJ0496598.1 hypothetical protein HanHA89_Chr13g0501661 [Helianthus annuus]
MSVQAQTPRNIEVTNGDQLEDERWVIESITNANAAPPPTARIPLVPRMVRAAHDYEKHFFPKVVSIGPHHFGNYNLELVEQLKPVFTMKLLSEKETLRSLYKKLGDPEMVKQLRSFYEENSTTMLSNKEFTKMMMQDSCFILYYIQYIFCGKPEDCPELKSHQVVFVHQDFFLLENQIPFKVLNEVINLLKIDSSNKFKPFIYENILSSGKLKRTWLESILRIQKNQTCREEPDLELTGHNEPDHILHLLHRTITKVEFRGGNLQSSYRCTFRNVNELANVGVHFKPSNTKSLAHVKFSKRRWWSANVELPPITVDDSTKPMLLNLIAYEMCSCDASDAWVTSYICLLDSLIDNPEDVKALRKAGILENSLGGDNEVTKLFNEIGTDLVPNSFAYMEAKMNIQKHYDSRKNTLISELMHEYVKSPWAFLALLGGLIALFLSAVQTWFSIWSPDSKCDELCQILKKTHHL